MQRCAALWGSVEFTLLSTFLRSLFYLMAIYPSSFSSVVSDGLLYATTIIPDFPLFPPIFLALQSPVYHCQFGLYLFFQTSAYSVFKRPRSF